MSGFQLSGPRSFSAQELSRSTKRTADCVNNHRLQGPVTLLYYTNVVFLAEVNYAYGRLIHEIVLEYICKGLFHSAEVEGTPDKHCDRCQKRDKNDWPGSRV